MGPNFFTTNIGSLPLTDGTQSPASSKLNTVMQIFVLSLSYLGTMNVYCCKLVLLCTSSFLIPFQFDLIVREKNSVVALPSLGGLLRTPSRLCIIKLSQIPVSGLFLMVFQIASKTFQVICIEKCKVAPCFLLLKI